MYYYTAYGLTIQSSIRLPELFATNVEEKTVDITISYDSVPKVPESIEGRWIRRVQADTNQCRVSYDSYGTFLISNGSEIVFDPDSPGVMQMRETRHLLETQILAILLHQRGRLVLHASAVSIDGNSIVFLGPSGVGKSSMAAAIHEMGYRVLEDDVVSVRIDQGVPIIDPGVPVLRLPIDSVEALDVERRNLHKDGLNKNKRFMDISYSPGSSNLDGCYIYKPGDEYRIEKLTSSENVLHVISNTYGRNLLSDMELQEDNFIQCSTVAENVPFRSIHRPSKLDDIKSHARKLVSDIQSI
jgi:hypothetical protein